MMDLDELRASIAEREIAFVITDPNRADNPIVAANEAFLRLTGYEMGEVLGRNPRFLQGPDSEESARAAVRDALSTGQPAITEILNYRKDGTRFRNAMMVAQVRSDAGETVFHLGSQVPLRGAEDWLERRDRAARLVGTLTPRQAEILGLIASGLQNKQIARGLGIGVETVKMHRASMLAKLGIASTAEAIRLAVEAGVGEGRG